MTSALGYLGRLICMSSMILVMTGIAMAQETVESVIVKLRAVQEAEAASVDQLGEAVANVQRIVDDFPASDAAVSILLGEPYDGIVFSSFAQRLQAASENEAVTQQTEVQADTNISCLLAAMPGRSKINLVVGFATNANGRLSNLPELVEPANPGSDVRLEYLKVASALEVCAPYESAAEGASYKLSMTDEGGLSFVPVTPSLVESILGQRVAAEAVVKLHLGSEETERLLGLNRQAIRDIQARLLVIGYDPNGIDGVLGRGTRSAIRVWQGSVGTTTTGFLNANQLNVLKNESQAALTQWLQVQRNANLYNPPKRATTPRQTNRLRNGWFRDRNGKYCRKTRIGLVYCTPKRPTDA